MTKIADILFFTGLGLVFLYFLMSILFPIFLKNRTKKQSLIAAMIPFSLILFSFFGYYSKNQSLSKHSLPKAYGIVEANLDSLNNELKSDTISFQKIDTIVNQIQQNHDEIKRIIAEQEELQKRVRIKQFNIKLSDSILKQIQRHIQEIELKKNYSLETKIVTSNGKIIMYNGKIVVMKEKIFNDRYTIDSLEIYPKLKRIEFKPNSSIRELNYYIDSLELRFKIVRNEGKALNNEIDSLIFLSVNPLNHSYTNYKHFKNLKNQQIDFLDSLYFTENSHNKIIIDFPNNNKSDTTICFDFFLKRGLLSSYCISF